MSAGYELKLGEWNVICDRCGFKRKSSQVTKTWDNLMVCNASTGKTCFETRHPQDFVRPVKDDTSVPFTRPEATETFVSTTPIATSVGVQETTVPTVTPGNASAL